MNEGPTRTERIYLALKGSCWGVTERSRALREHRSAMSRPRNSDGRVTVRDLDALRVQQNRPE
jgi:hypothetical protein